jgi:uncharacterized protein
MKCPNCNETLLMTHRNNIEIDYCPSCRGVWLDKGELDKLLDYEARTGNQTQHTYADGQQERYEQRNDESHKKLPRKKKSFLGDFFDFD